MVKYRAEDSARLFVLKIRLEFCIMLIGERMKKYLKFAESVARSAGKIMKKYYHGDKGSDYKGDNTIVTKADKEINDLLIARVKKCFPEHCVDGEEKKFGKSEYVWTCDPVDGTAMYARNLPVSVFSLALVVNGEPVVGVVLDPWQDELYSAVKGGGAFKNGKPIHVSDVNLYDKRSVSHFDMWPRAGFEVWDILEEIGMKSYWTSIGSVTRACMCVASGDFTCVLFPGTKGKNVDIAAAKVIVEEAGGRVTNFYGKEQRYDTDLDGAVVSNGVCHKELVRLIKKHAKSL